MLLDIDSRRLTGRANHYHGVGTFGDMPVEQALEPGQIERAVLVHRRNDGRNGTLYGLHERIRNSKRHRLQAEAG
jgi:hypothetical protein